MNLIFLDEFYLLERYINVVFRFVSFRSLYYVENCNIGHSSLLQRPVILGTPLY